MSISWLSGNINVKPSPPKENNSKITLHTFSFYNYDTPAMLSEYDNSNCNKKHDNSK